MPSFWPTLTRSAPAQVEFSLLSNTVSFESPLSGASQTVEFPGARWKISFLIENLKEPDSAILQAWGISLRGQAGRFYLYNFARPQPRGTISGSPLVKGAGQLGNTLLIDGCTIGTTLLMGDFFKVGSELKIIVADSTANGSGEMTLTFEPPLRAAPADNAQIITDKPTAIFKLTDDSFRALTHGLFISNFSIDAIESWL